jgi:uncharacterized Ntn-hydrolase superfamily protein
MAGAFEAAVEEPLVRALEAGQPSGGDRRGTRAPRYTWWRAQPYLYLELQVDEHPDPVAELRRTYEVAKVELLPFIEASPTRKNPKGGFGEEVRGALITE